jgi:hypothetical protein
METHLSLWMRKNLQFRLETVNLCIYFTNTW